MTLADFWESASDETGVTDRETIFPLLKYVVSEVLACSGMIIPEAEEVADVLLGGCGRDARDVNSGVARHYGWKRSTNITVKSDVFSGERRGRIGEVNYLSCRQLRHM